MKLRKDKTKKVISLFDIHYWEHIDLTPVLKFIKDEQPDEIILGWDQLDLFTISKYYKWDMEDGIYKARQEILAFKPFLENLKKITPKSKIIWIDWNHEFRIEENTKIKPDRKLLLDYKKEYKWLVDKFFKYKESYQIGKLHFTHGEHHNIAHAKKHVETYWCNVVYGHMHEVQSFTKKTRTNEHPFVAKSRPCLSTLDPDYKNREANWWVNWFGITYFKPDGNFFDYNIIMINGTFIYWWKTY